MFGAVHAIERRVEQLPLLIARQSPVAARLGLLLHAHPEAMERRLVEEWRCLRHAPIDRRAQCLEHAMDRREFDFVRIVGLGLESVDLVGPLQVFQWQCAEMRFQDRDATANCSDAAQSRRLHAAIDVRIEKTRYVVER
jgi:hypothetical protein